MFISVGGWSKGEAGRPRSRGGDQEWRRQQADSRRRCGNGESLEREGGGQRRGGKGEGHYGGCHKKTTELWDRTVEGWTRPGRGQGGSGYSQ